MTTPPAPDQPTPRALSESLDIALSEAPWLGPEDVATLAVARALIAQIDDVTANGTMAEKVKVLYLVPHLINALSSLGLTPAGREKLGVGNFAWTEIERRRKEHLNRATVLGLKQYQAEREREKAEAEAAKTKTGRKPKRKELWVS